MGERSGRPISIYADARAAEQAEAVALAENRKIGQLGGEALAFWVSLPAAARAALRFIEGLGTVADQEYVRREVTRVLLSAQRDVASERASQEIRAQFEGLKRLNDEELEELAVELSREPPEKRRMGERPEPTKRSPGARSGGRSRSGKS